MLAFALLLTAGSAWAATLTYDFNNGSLQGWYNRVWDLNANGGSGGWVDLDPNVSAMPATINNGVIQPESGDNNLFGNNGSQVDPVGGHNDNHLNTLWLRSPKFALDGSGDLTVQMSRGRAHGPAPADEAAVSYMSADGNANTGWKGVALRNVSSGAFVLAKPRTGEGDGMTTVTFTAAELAPFVGVPCTLELINSERGGWGWLSMDNVSIPGVLRQTKLEVASPSVTVGGSTTVTITIPSDANASTAVTAYLTNLNSSIITINGSAATMIPLTFAAGAASSQTVTVTGTALGYAPLVVTCAGLDKARGGVTVLPVSGLIGRWISGSEDLLDKAGYAPAGTHDGLMSDSLSPVFSPDVPPGATGSSLDMGSTWGNAVLISNSAFRDPGYLPTFDEAIARQFSIVFWAKDIPSEWNPFISKHGEGSTGWQVRRRHTSPIATFTLRGTSSEDDPYNAFTFVDDYSWHHFAAVWDGVTGTRKLYVDGKLNSVLSHDFGPMGLANASYLCLGGRVGPGSTTPGNTFAGQLYDVRIYGIPLSGSAVQSLYNANTSAIIAHSDRTSVDLGQSGVISVAIPAGANASSTVTVYVTNTTPAVISLAGAVNNVATLVFPAGTPNSQTVTVTGLAQGQAQLACAATGLTKTSVSLQVYGPRMIGRWFTGAENFADASGFAQAGTHDGVEVGNPGGITFSADTPPSKTGKSAKFDKTSALMINNSSALDFSYAPTFDDMISRQFTVSFWAKGIPDTWNAFLSKRGEEAIGWQVRRSGDVTGAFTVRGTGSSNPDGVGSVAINDNQWHHFAAVWDGYTGTRRCYLDGVLDTNINIINDFGPMTLAPNHHLVLGARETAAVSFTPGYEGYFQGSLYDVSLYNYPLSETQVKELAFVPALRVIPAQRTLEAPGMMTVDVILPAGANESQPVTVQVTDDNPAVASLLGALNNAVTLNFPVGGSLTQQVSVIGIKDGKGKLTATGGGYVAGSGTFNVWADPGQQLIGRWISGAGDLVETSGFRPAGTHDGVAVGPNAPYLMFSPDVPPAYSGSALSLDLTTGDLAVVITNSCTTEVGYVETFDNQIAKKFSLAFWAKGTPASGWNPWISKYGEGAHGFQMRRYSDDNPVRPTFTVRGSEGVDDPWQGTTINDSEWHHYTGTWDGLTGIRRLFIDGKPVLTVTGDFGTMGIPTLERVVLGGREYRGSFGNFFAGLLFDVRIYSYALDPVEVAAIVNPPSALSLSLSPLVAPTGETVRLVVNVPSGTTANAPLTVYLTNNSPAVVKFAGSTENVIPVIFPVGSVAQSVQLVTIGVGQINITAGAAGQAPASLATVNTVVERKLIGHWFTGTAELADKSGYTPVGTHDAVVVGANPEMLTFSSDVPPKFQGQSLDLTGNATGTVGVMVNNTAADYDANYQPTFDEGISGTFTVALWAKGVPGGWNGFISKRGEDGIGWQLRRSGGETEAFTIRGTASGNVDGVGSIAITDGQWHHFAGVWNGVTGTRKCYVDGVLDPSVDLVEDFAPMNLAPSHHLAIGAREAASQGMFEGWFNGKIYDVRVYNYPITSEDVALLAGVDPAGPPMTIQPWTDNQVRISWPTSFTGYTIEQSASIPDGWAASGLAVTVEGNENVAYAPTMGSAQFYRLKK